MLVKDEDLGRAAIEKKGWISAFKWLFARRLTQISILGLFLAGPWLGVWILKGNIASSQLLDTVPMTDPLLFLQMLGAGFLGMASPALIGAALVICFYLVVGGRSYCAWVCPMNVITDAAHWLRRRFGLKSSSHIKRNTRVWIVAMVLVLAAATGTLAYELINPVSLLYRGLIFGMGMGWLLVAAIFLFDLFVLKHGWCGHLCPMGAVYSQIGRASLLRVRADHRERCDNCMECYAVCPEPHVIPPALKGAAGESMVITSGDCTNCGRCIDICPEEVFNFGLRFPAVRETEAWATPAQGKAEA